MNIPRFAALVSCLPLLAACGGTDVGSTGPLPFAPGPAGYYAGEVISPVTGLDDSAVALVSGDGETRIVDVVSGSQYLVSLPSAGGHFDASLTGFAGPTIRFPNTSPLCHGSVSGDFEPAAEFFGDYACGGDHGTLNLAFDDGVSFNPPDVAELTGEWQTFIAPTVVLAIIVAPDGGFTGSDTDGCAYRGTLAAADPIINLYAMTLVQTCGSTALALTGLATQTSAPHTGQFELYYGVSNGAHSLAGLMLLQ
ncbi:MAG: hypothetical protein ACM3ZT_09775 [Bacillota bacterium]